MKNQEEKQGFATKLFAIPSLIMKGYVKGHRNTDNYQAMYSPAWFIAAIAMAVLTVICFLVDFEVLFGIEYNATANETYSWRTAAMSATIIQFLIIVCGGVAFKTFIFGKLLDRSAPTMNWYFWNVPRPAYKHVLQFLIYSTLFAYGFYWTIDLSSKTYHAAKANAAANKTELINNHNNNQVNLSTEQQQKRFAINKKYDQQITGATAPIQAQIDAIDKKYTAKVENRKQQLRNKAISKGFYQNRLADYAIRQAKETAPLLDKLVAPVTSINDKRNTELAALDTEYRTAKTGAATAQVTETNELNASIEATAKATQGRNIRYNIINVVLMIGLLFFAKGSIDEENNSTPSPSGGKKKHSNTATNTDNAAHSSDTPHEAPQTVQKAQFVAVNTDTTIQNTATKENTETQRTMDIDIQYNTVQDTAPQVFEFDGYKFKRKEGILLIKHKEKFVNRKTLKTWIATYSRRVLKYTNEGKSDRAQTNAKTVESLMDKQLSLDKLIANEHAKINQRENKSITNKDIETGRLSNLWSIPDASA